MSYSQNQQDGQAACPWPQKAGSDRATANAEVDVLWKLIQEGVTVRESREKVTAENTALRERLNASDARNLKAEKEYAKLFQENNELRLKVERLQCSEETKELRERVTNLTEENKALRANIDRRFNVNADLEARNSEIKKMYTKLFQENNELRLKVERLQCSEDARVRGYEALASDACKKNNALRAQVAYAETRCTEVEYANGGLAKANKTLGETVARLEASTNEVLADKAKLVEENEKLREPVKRLQNYSDADNARFAEENRQLHAEIKTLRQQIAQMHMPLPQAIAELERKAEVFDHIAALARLP